jgi:hypothetical protein
MTGIYSVDVVLQMDPLMMVLTGLVRAAVIYILLILIPSSWGIWGKALVIASLIQIYMIGSVLLYRRKHRIE